MEERLIVKHFGPITEVDVLIRPITVFIGTQGSGKSTLSKLLTIFKDVQWRLNLLEEKDEFLTPFRKFNIHHFFRKDTVFHYYSDDGLEISFSEEHFTISPKENIEAYQLEYKKRIEEENNSFLRKAGYDNTTQEQLTANQKYLLQANSRMTLYIPAERIFAGVLSDSLASIILAKIPINEPLLEFVSLYERAKRFIPEYHVPFLGVSFKSQDGEDKIIAVDGTPLPFSAASSGIQSSFPMLMVIDYGFKANCFNSFVIEEPELNLFPSNQRELLHFLLQKSFGIECDNIIITTHSPYLLSCLNVALLAHKVNAFSSRDENKDLFEYALPREHVAVYSLNPEKEPNATSMINEKTGLIGMNSLDGVSEMISDEFQQLLTIYKTLLSKK